MAEDGSKLSEKQMIETSFTGVPTKEVATDTSDVDVEAGVITNGHAPDTKQAAVQEEKDGMEGEVGDYEDDDDDDPWIATLPELSQEEQWSALSNSARARFVFFLVVKIIFLMGFLYFFICSLDFLSSAFRLLGGLAAGEVLNDHFLLSNPVCALMMGVLVTVLVQSSSTSTSIVVAMVSASIIGVRQAIPIVMGANVGTSVTNTIVALGQVKERNEFRRAFGGATVHDVFNWLTVFIFLPIEVASHYLESLTGWILGSTELQKQDSTVEILKAITGPFTNLVIQIDKSVITDVAQGLINASDARLLKVCEPIVNCTYEHLFAYTSMSDLQVGIIMLAVSILILFVCLFSIVKLLHSMLKGSIALVIKKFINADFPGPLRYFTGYFAIAIGAGLTFVVQSSSIFTSAITPLVGIGVITLDRMYPLTLGANIGTTATGILAALAAGTGTSLFNSLQVALCHLFFNISGIIIWYPLPFMRKVPIMVAKILGNTTAEYRWFALLYLIMMFFIIPAIIIGLSLAGGVYLLAVGVPILAFFVVIVVMNVLQRKIPRILPKKLRNWDFLPLWLHSLEPLDRLLVCSCVKKRLTKKRSDSTEKYADASVDNPAFDEVYREVSS